MFEKLIDTKISLATIIGWGVALIGLTFSMSSAYGESKQKLLFLAERQTKIEISLERLETSVRILNDAMIRIEQDLKSRKEK
jgi:hypothetical protein